MQCPYCHADLADGQRCCPSCGQFTGTAGQDQLRAEKLTDLIRRDAERTSQLNSNSRQAGAAGEKKLTVRFILALLALNLIAAGVFYFMTLRPLGKYNAASELFDAGRYSDAAVMYEALGNYRDSAAQIQRCQEGMKEQRYQDAIAALESGDYTRAISEFSDLSGYQDSAKYLMRAKKKIVAGLVPACSWDFTESLEPDRGEIETKVCGDVALVPPQSGSFRQVASFDGDGDYIDCGRDLNMTEEWTLAVTFNPADVYKHYAGIFTKYESSGSGPYALSVCDTAVDFMVTAADGTQIEMKSPMSITENHWFHAIVRREGDQLAFFVNGMLQCKETLPADVMSNSDTVTIGRQALLHTPDQLQFSGQIADAAIYDYALTDSEIAILSEVRLENAK